ncbi:MAG: TIGR01244 family sulfur transferase [Pseudomonadales bacterium]|nr:TIGR01244 family sulfur transferase [Pseudomonadales bacterium]
MQARKLTETFSVAEQISVDDIADIAAQGFKSILCNRPDHEAADQPDYDQIRQAAQQHGLQIRQVPIVSGQVSLNDIDDFATAQSELPEPVLAYCRTGTRSSQLWALATASRGEKGIDEILATAAQAGYDLSGMSALLTSLRSAGSTS